MPGRLPANLHATPRTLLSRRNFLLTAAASAAGLALYSNEIARHEIETTELTLSLRRLPPAFDGFRIVHISDIHLEEFAEDFFVREVIRRVNLLAPDLVLITGDFCSRSPLPWSYGRAAAARCAQLLTTLTCSQRFGVLGNHDAVVGAREVRKSLEDAGTPLLLNQYVPIERSGQRLWLAGLDDCLGGHPNLDLALPTMGRASGSRAKSGVNPGGDPDSPVLLMAHEPDIINVIAAHPRGQNVDLVLAGHTHGGQVRIPGLRPLMLPPLGQLFPEGHFSVGNIQLYVNRGIGTVGLPLRLNCPPEITHITLRPAPPVLAS